MPLTSPGNDDDTGENHQPTLRKNTAEPVEQTLKQNSNIPLGIGGDIANFKSAAHLAAYAGIAPATGQSGTSIKGERPSRRGNKRLKNALWQSSFVASAKHPPSIAYYKRKREQGKRHNAAVICLARRRCDVIYSMLKNGVLYQEPVLVA